MLFTLSDGTTKLSHEIEDYDSATGKLISWVKVHTLSSTQDTILYLYYGNQSAENQENKTDVWSNGYVGVWHMNDKTTSTIFDSTSNNNHGTKKAVNEPIEIDGKIGKAQNFDGSNDYIDCGAAVSIKPQLPVTVSAWVNKSQTTADTRTIFANNETNNTNANHRGIRLGLDKNNKIDIHYGSNSGGCAPSSRRSKTGSSSILINNWTYISTIVRGALDMNIIFNSSDDGGTYSGNGGNLGYSSDSANIGRGQTGGGCINNYFPGKIDELRFSNVARSPEWIATEYANQNDPASFYTVGQEETI
ncbi:MAG: DUF2341 domain-containing protein [Candidatus Pacebacteria bacterium]|nr:DUF2341 domain-containing protein [Candidatus Paceibacterota bacterium]